jgi:hypothetical protein
MLAKVELATSYRRLITHAESPNTGHSRGQLVLPLHQQSNNALTCRPSYCAQLCLACNIQVFKLLNTYNCTFRKSGFHSRYPNYGSYIAITPLPAIYTICLMAISWFLYDSFPRTQLWQIAKLSVRVILGWVHCYYRDLHLGKQWSTLFL